MRYNIISAKEAIPNYIENETRYDKHPKPIGVVYCEGSTAYHYMMDSNRPGNYSVFYGCKFDSPFKKFELVTNGGIGCGTETTCISVYMGYIDDNSVLFVYPTSEKVNHKEIEEYFKTHFPELFFIEFDINFNVSSVQRKLKEKENV